MPSLLQTGTLTFTQDYDSIYNDRMHGKQTSWMQADKHRPLIMASLSVVNGGAKSVEDG